MPKDPTQPGCELRRYRHTKTAYVCIGTECGHEAACSACAWEYGGGQWTDDRTYICPRCWHEGLRRPVRPHRNHKHVWLLGVRDPEDVSDLTQVGEFASGAELYAAARALGLDTKRPYRSIDDVYEDEWSKTTVITHVREWLDPSHSSCRNARRRR